MEFLKLFSFLFKFFSNHRVVLDNFTLEIFTISQSLLNLLLKIVLVFDSFAAVGNKLFCKFLDLINFLLELKDGLTFSLDHFFEVIALEDKLRNSFFVISFVSPANFDEDIQSFMLKE
jgi:hypothetical protein